MITETMTKPTTIVKTKDLRRALHQLLPAAATRQTLPIIRDVLITPDPDGLMMECTDLETALRVKVDAARGMLLSDPVAVPIRTLRKVVQTFGDEIELSRDDERLILRDDTRLIKLARDCEDDFPIIPEIGSDVRWHEFPGLVGRIRKMVVTSCRDESRATLASVFITPREMVSTDTHRLQRSAHEQELECWPEEGVIVPCDVLSKLPRMLGAKADDTVLVGLPADEKPGNIHFKAGGGGAYAVSRLIEAQYPNYQKVIPAETERSWTLDSSMLVNRLRSLEPFAADDGNRVVFSQDGCQLIASAASCMLGEAAVKTELLATEGDNEGFEIAMNVRYLIELLRLFPPGSPVTFSMTKNLSPIKITSDADRSRVLVIMPMGVR